LAKVTTRLIVELVITSGPLSAFITGAAFGLSLIVAIGAQNTFVLRQGALRQHVRTIVVICAASDAILICAGVAGAGAALNGRPWLLTAVRAGGATVLLVYGALAARRALTQRTALSVASPATSSRTAAIAACLAFTWLNPAVYLDTVVLLGSVANSHPGGQWWFAAGAMLTSAMWFTALGFGASLLAPILTRPRAWHALDWLVAVMMTLTAARVLFAA
jgi:L-lysine exporter family protein LysE/ArgO